MVVLVGRMEVVVVMLVIGDGGKCDTELLKPEFKGFAENKFLLGKFGPTFFWFWWGGGNIS